MPLSPPPPFFSPHRLFSFLIAFSGSKRWASLCHRCIWRCGFICCAVAQVCRLYLDPSSLPFDSCTFTSTFICRSFIVSWFHLLFDPLSSLGLLSNFSTLRFLLLLTNNRHFGAGPIITTAGSDSSAEYILSSFFFFLLVSLFLPGRIISPPSVKKHTFFS